MFKKRKQEFIMTKMKPDSKTLLDCFSIYCFKIHWYNKYHSFFFCFL